jgi:hypothetical protein
MSVANKRSAMKYKENFSTGTLMAPATPRIQAGKFSEPKSSEPPGEALKTSKYQLSVSEKKLAMVTVSVAWTLEEYRKFQT